MNRIAIGALCALALLTILVGGALYLTKTGVLQTKPDAAHGYMKPISEAAINADLERLKSVEPTFPAIRKFFVDLADQDGGVYAFEVLKRAQLPPNTDLHLMGHAVGDELYKQQGLEGMKYCTNDFRNACSHSIVIGALLKDGMKVFDEVNAICHTAPGGPGAYTMCFHGFGHGVLAYVNYEFSDGVKLCEKVGTPEYHNEEADQCIGGMVMEMFQGQNDPQAWAVKKDKYLSDDKPLQLCQADFMPADAKLLCFTYITPYIFQAAGAADGNPTPDMFKKSFAFCDPVTDKTLRLACYGGLGKEFIVLAQDRDIRNIADTSDDKLKLTLSWCDMATKEEAKTSCITSVVDSLFWGGENDFHGSVRFCSFMDTTAHKDSCFGHLFDIAIYYQHDPSVKKAICAAVPAAYQKTCTARLLIGVAPQTGA